MHDLGDFSLRDVAELALPACAGLGSALAAWKRPLAAS
jgi:hypothetical protein